MRTLLIATALTSLAACVPEAPPLDGEAAFMADCAGCHGAAAQGDGPLAAGLDTAPPDLTRIAARNGGTFPRDRVMSTIDGLNRGAHFSDAMPEFGAGDMGPIVMTNDGGNPMPVPAELLALTDYLERIQR